MHTTDQRIRGRKLQRIRRLHFQLHPLCVVCQRQGLINVATQLDHIIPLFKGGPDTDANRQGLCDECHEAKTRRDLGQVEWHGSAADGTPTDPSHHWNR